MTSRIGLLDWGEGGKSSSLLAVQLLLAMLILANGRYERRTKVIRPLALLLVGLLTLVMVVAVLEESHRRPADLLMSSAIAAVFTNLTIGLSFHMGPAGFGRLMADAVSGLILLFIMLFYYSAKPDVLLWRSACYLGLFAIVLLIDSWFDPRGARRPS